MYYLYAIYMTCGMDCRVRMAEHYPGSRRKPAGA